MNSILKLDYAEFYITNVCNLTCNGCNRFNSFRIKGWQAWSQYKSIYEKWSQQLNIGIISIMGGEPLLNPEFYQWVDEQIKEWCWWQDHGWFCHEHPTLLAHREFASFLEPSIMEWLTSK